MTRSGVVCCSLFYYDYDYYYEYDYYYYYYYYDSTYRGVVDLLPSPSKPLWSHRQERSTVVYLWR